MEMILWRWPLVSAVQADWHNVLARFCLTELVVSSSSSSLQTESNILAQTNNTYPTHNTANTVQCCVWLVFHLTPYLQRNLYLIDRLVMVYLLKVFVCFTVLIKGLCFKPCVFFGVCRKKNMKVLISISA